jgi:hypothetical protein
VRARPEHQIADEAEGDAGAKGRHARAHILARVHDKTNRARDQAA